MGSVGRRLSGASPIRKELFIKAHQSDATWGLSNEVKIHASLRLSFDQLKLFISQALDISSLNIHIYTMYTNYES